MISNLQVVRGLAALAVAFYHTAFTFNGSVHTDFQAVAVFFVISGFIMTYITRGEAKQFFAQRIIRVVPLYWLFTLLPVAATWFKGSGRIWGEASPETLLQSLLFIPYQDAAGDMHPLLAVGWTLNLEMFFYVVFAVALVRQRPLGAALNLRRSRDVQACPSTWLFGDGLRVLRPRLHNIPYRRDSVVLCLAGALAPRPPLAGGCRAPSADSCRAVLGLERASAVCRKPSAINSCSLVLHHAAAAGDGSAPPAFGAA
jgi:peptidoglycan/LPS O-acetylase OafA/YrhL